MAKPTFFITQFVMNFLFYNVHKEFSFDKPCKKFTLICVLFCAVYTQDFGCVTDEICRILLCFPPKRTIEYISTDSF